MSEVNKLHMNMFYHFWSLIDYQNIILETSVNIAESEIEARLKNIDEPQEKYFIAEELHDYFETDSLHLTTSSIIINLFSRIEVCLRQLCKELEQNRNTSYRFNDMHGSVLKKTKDFYEKNNLQGYSIEVHNLFSTIQKLRDCFVHCNGYLNESRDKEYLLTLVASGDLRIVNYELSVNIDYCKDILLKAKDGMIEIYTNSGFPMSIE
jgi:hypothetical protein